MGSIREKAKETRIQKSRGRSSPQFEDEVEEYFGYGEQLGEIKNTPQFDMRSKP